MIKTAYIAGGWFNPEQLARVEEIEKACLLAGIESYSPRKHGIYKPGDNPESMVEENKTNILEADLVVASTEGKDMGTLWECGYAYGKTPVLYYFPADGKFNIMLSATAVDVCTTEQNLRDSLKYLSTHSIVQYVMHTEANTNLDLE